MKINADHTLMCHLFSDILAIFPFVSTPSSICRGYIAFVWFQHIIKAQKLRVIEVKLKYACILLVLVIFCFSDGNSTRITICVECTSIRTLDSSFLFGEKSN